MVKRSEPKQMLRPFIKIDTDMNTAIEIKKNIYWLGVNDRRTHIFENYWPLPKGVAYNSYVIVDEKTVVLDTVERSRMDDYLESLEAVLAGRPASRSSGTPKPSPCWRTITASTTASSK